MRHFFLTFVSLFRLRIIIIRVFILTCLQHSQTIRYFCSACNLAICHDCTKTDHAGHRFDLIDDIADKEMSIMDSLVREARIKQEELVDKYQV